MTRTSTNRGAQNKAGGPTRQAARRIVVTTLTANIFAEATTVLTRQNKANWPGPKAVYLK